MYQVGLMVYIIGEYDRNLVETKLRDLACDLQADGFQCTLSTFNLTPNE